MYTKTCESCRNKIKIDDGKPGPVRCPKCNWILGEEIPGTAGKALQRMLSNASGKIAALEAENARLRDENERLTNYNQTLGPASMTKDRIIENLEHALKNGGIELPSMHKEICRLREQADKLIRFMIGQDLVPVDDMPDDQMADEAIEVISRLRERVAEFESANKVLRESWDELSPKIEAMQAVVEAARVFDEASKWDTKENFDTIATHYGVAVANLKAALDNLSESEE